MFAEDRLLALLVGFLVMQFVRYSSNKEKYEQMLPQRREPPTSALRDPT